MIESNRSKHSKIAIFTIPGMVAFEGQHHLLHIFEPRNQKMIDYCIDNQAHLGLALPKTSVTKVDKSLQSKNSKGVGSYLQAHEVLGAGPVNIIKTMDDGRYLVAVNIQQTVKITAITQSLPFPIADVEALETRVENPDLATSSFHRMTELCQQILGDKFSYFKNRIPENVWQKQDLNGLMVKVMEWFRLEGSDCQDLLEERRLDVRAETYLEVMEQYTKQMNWNEEQPVAYDQRQVSGDGVEFSPTHQVGVTEVEDNLIKVNFGEKFGDKP